MSDKLPAALHPVVFTREIVNIMPISDLEYAEIQARRQEALDQIAELTARTGGYDGDVF